MAVAYTNLNAISTTSSPYTTPSVTPAAGTYLIATVAGVNSATPTITDSLGGSWTLISLVPNGTSLFDSIFIRTTVSTGASLTVTYATYSGTKSFQLGAISGASGTYSSVNSATGTTAITSVTTPASVASGDLFYALIGTTPLITSITAGSGWTGTSAIGARSSLVQTQVSTSAGQTVSSTATIAGTSSFTINQALVFYQPAKLYNGWGAPLA